MTGSMCDLVRRLAARLHGFDQESALRLALARLLRGVPGLDRIFTRIAGRVAGLAGQPLAFIAAISLVFGWILTGPIFQYSDSWQLVVNTATTIITFLMVFLIQNSQNRDAAAMQAKLDEIIRAMTDARNEFVGIEHRTDQEIERIRAELEQECDDAPVQAGAAASVTRLSRRY